MKNEASRRDSYSSALFDLTDLFAGTRIDHRERFPVRCFVPFVIDEDLGVLHFDGSRHGQKKNPIVQGDVFASNESSDTTFFLSLSLSLFFLRSSAQSCEYH